MPSCCVNLLPTFRALYFSIVPSAFLLTKYTHFVSTIWVPSGISDIRILVKTWYLRSCSHSLVLPFAHSLACGDVLACWSVGWSGSAPTANIFGFLSLVDLRLPTRFVHSSAVRCFFFGAAFGPKSSGGESGRSQSDTSGGGLSSSLELSFDSSSGITGVGFLASFVAPSAVLTQYVPKVVVL